MTNKATKYGLMTIAAVLLVAMAFAGAVSASWNVTYHYDTVDSLDPVTVAVDNKATAYGNQWAYQPGKVMAGWAIAPDYNVVKYTAGATIPKQTAESTLDLYLVVENNLQFAGSGSSVDPYQISSTDDLKNLSANVNSGECYIGAYFSLEADELDFAYDSFWPIGNKTVYPFQGNFDGKYHVIKNMSITPGSISGLFGSVKNADISNLILQNVNNSGAGSSNIGILAGRYDVDDSKSHSIKNLELDNVSIGQTWGKTGFIIGVVYTGESSLCIENCTIKNSTSITYYTTCPGGGWSYAFGGFIGVSEGSALTFSNCGIENSIVSATSGYGAIGGCGAFIGNTNTPNVYFKDNCRVIGCIIASDYNAAGLIGCMDGGKHIEATDVTVCDTVITALPNGHAGGLIAICNSADGGIFTRCKVINCTVNGAGTYGGGTGGLVGTQANGYATVQDCLVQDLTLNSKWAKVGGFFGRIDSNSELRLTFGTGNILKGTNSFTGISDVHALVGNAFSDATVVGEERVSILTTPIITTTGTAIIFDGNGGVSTAGKIYLTTNTSAVGTALSIAAPTCAGYTFGGWNISNTDTMLIGTDKKLIPNVEVSDVEYTNDTVWRFTDPYLTVDASWIVNTTNVTATGSKAVFGNYNVTAIHSTSGIVVKVLLEDVSNVTDTAVNFTADNTTVSIPSVSGYDKDEIAVFEINATVDGTAKINVTVTFADAATATANKDKIRFMHFNTTNNAWDTLHLTNAAVEQTGENVLYTVETNSFSPFGIGIYTVLPPVYTPSSSSKQTGSTIILSEGQVAPTAYATATPTVAPTVKPTEQPATPTVIATAKPTTQATQQSPAPFVGIMAGLGAAAVLLRLRK